MKEVIRKQILQAIKNLFPKVEVDFSVDFAPENIDADFASNVALVVARKIGMRPMEAATVILNLIQDPKFGFRLGGRNDSIFATVVPPGFLNFKFSPDTLADNLQQINKQKDKYGSSKLGQGKLAIVEYFQLNVAKPPHVGHLRSAVIGDALKKILRFVGYKTMSDTHIGDWGTQFGVLLWAFKNLSKEQGLDLDVDGWNALYVEGAKRVEDDPKLREGAKREFVLLENGDKQNRKLWKAAKDTTTRIIISAGKQLGLEKFDKNLGESFYEDKMPQVTKRLEVKGLLKTGETGEKYVDLEKYGLGRLICVKSDGGTTYEMRDLATLAYRYDELTSPHPSSRGGESKGRSRSRGGELGWNLYVVDSRQAHDFKQVFKTMEMLGYDVAKSKHVDFGFMSLPEGAISTRKGRVVNLSELIEEAIERAKKIIEEKNPELRKKDEVAKAVGLAALKYFDLKHNRHSDIVFDWEEALSFEGNTGPYLQYTHARLKSILRKANNLPQPLLTRRGVKTEGWGGEELGVMRKLAVFEDTVLDAAREFQPNILANYLFELAEKINLFYQKVPVLQEENKDKRDARLFLVAASAQVLKNGLGLLGIDAPEEM